MQTKEELEDLLVTQKLTYEEIGRKEGVTKYAIKKRARDYGINLQRIAYKVHNRSYVHKEFCQNCSSVPKYGHVYCSDKCRQDYRIKALLCSDFDSLAKWSKRKVVLLEQRNKCNRCGLNKWQGEALTLELEHIDGENKNNARANLECLCPNCHSLTKTWRGRNKRKNIDSISDDALYKAYENSPSIHQALLSVELSETGGNYKRMRCVIEKFK